MYMRRVQQGEAPGESITLSSGKCHMLPAGTIALRQTPIIAFVAGHQQIVQSRLLFLYTRESFTLAIDLPVPVSLSLPHQSIHTPPG